MNIRNFKKKIKDKMAVDLRNQSCTINDISEECLLIIIKIVLFSDPNIKLSSLLYINKIFLELIKKNIYFILPGLKEEEIIIPIPYSYIWNNKFTNKNYPNLNPTPDLYKCKSLNILFIEP